MKLFIITALADALIIIFSCFLFKKIISGPTRERIYEKYFSSFAKFIIFLFLFSLAVTLIITLLLYKTRFIVYINIIEPSILSVFVGLIAAILPGKEKQKHDGIKP